MLARRVHLGVQAVVSHKDRQNRNVWGACDSFTSLQTSLPCVLPFCTCRWTNGLFKSTLHRVVNTTATNRYSCAFFFEPNFNTRVECLPCCVSEERPAAYPPTTAGEHLLAKYAQTHAGYDVNRKQQQNQQ